MAGAAEVGEFKLEGFRFLATICQKQNDELGASQALKFAQQLEKE